MTDSELPHLNAIEARVLGCLMEKQLITPDVYPLTQNALEAAANQKSAREPVMALDGGDIYGALTSLEAKGLARRVSGSRVERFEQRAGDRFRLTKQHGAILALLLLRGPQTVNELLTRSARMADFSGPDGLREELDMMIGRRPSLVKEIGRAPGQREDRFAHLLCGDVDVSDIVVRAPSGGSHPMDERIAALEAEVAALKARLDAAGL